MELAKPRVDIGMSTNHLEAVLAFWQGEAGVPFDHLLPIRRGPVRASTAAGIP
jgi:lactoylglutathione lyase